MRDRLNNSWGQFCGTIYTDFCILGPLRILSEASGNRKLANPIIVYTIRQPKRWYFVFSGCNGLGRICCELNPKTRPLLGFPELSGYVLVDQNSIGVIRVSKFPNSWQLAKFTATDEKSELSLERDGLSGKESGVLIRHNDLGLVARIPRFDYAWHELCQSKMGFGRLERGSIEDLEGRGFSKDLKQAALVLLCVYFQLLRLPFNTESEAS